ncbi:RNA polymerase III subunit [Cavenderia fasciculata]|uniref:DNA-directed RNA polymerase III subunit RPC6 n=1 Tax=Cavenderia fasciculata TaxID=261658 RepID=F4PU89_CACFS|nr:RNA polymerase III subunit [Cavenderia fasciculata]EGG21804.1 RNA polymerase III subunit [Cavenderia fasciculata]|eukprot:XP_004359654.1 RNA polymerase III subunit [Cavenderia fasciculata]
MSKDIEDKFLVILQQHPTGISQKDFKDELGGDNQAILTVINKLVKEGRIIYIQNPDGSTSYREVTTLEDQSKFKGLSADEMLIYQIIEDSKDKGAWTKDMRGQTNLQQVQITKIIKTLETRKLIKAVKTIDAGKKKVYMSYSMEPSRDLTGGSLYSGGQTLDQELINAMKWSCSSFISNKGAADISEVMNYLKKQGEKDLTEEDILTLLNSLIYDGLVEEMRDTRAKHVLSRKPTGIIYKPTKTKIPENHFTKMPCGNCPVFHLCSEVGEITPAKYRNR